ncbi:hypothetical protein BGZ91_006796 [Linnemannia elongata]|nr:hypothetical protein BGZ91_006796 [Linnemannia elongata]KAG0046711.1 hypothetical protein BGZ90_008098 [Linnemannia elongata]
MPGFVFELLVPLENGGLCVLDASGPQSVGRAVTVLRQQSSVDNTQAIALVETLEREIALINGFGGVLSKVRWMNERPLGGMRSNEEHLQALQKIKQESSEEGSKQRIGGQGTVLEWMLERMDKGMTALLQEAKRQDVAAEFSVI